MAILVESRARVQYRAWVLQAGWWVPAGRLLAYDRQCAEAEFRHRHPYMADVWTWQVLPASRVPAGAAEGVQP